MSNSYFQEITFEKIDFSADTMPKGEYEGCRFVNCNFADANFAHYVFVECEFEGCNLSMAKMNNTALREVIYKNCKMLGIHFEYANDFLFSVAFDTCTLNLSSFYKKNLKKIKFKNCNLSEVDFTEADLSQSIFDNCDLASARFENSILEKADFRTAYNYVIDPEMNKIKKAKFSMAGIAGLLQQYGIEIS